MSVVVHVLTYENSGSSKNKCHVIREQMRSNAHFQYCAVLVTLLYNVTGYLISSDYQLYVFRH
jgi:hypothetical protein